MKRGHLYSFKVPLHKILNYREKKGNFIVKKAPRYHLPQIIKMTTISNKRNQNHVLPNKMQR